MDQLRSAAAIQGGGEGQTLVMPPLSKVSHASVIATPNAHSEESRNDHQVDRQILLHEFYLSVITGDATKIMQLARYINLDAQRWDKSGAITKDTDGATALHLAAFHNQPASVEALCSMGGSVETPAFEGEYDGNPLHVATRQSHIECLQAMVHYCGTAAFYDVDMDGKTPLDIAHDGHHGAGAKVFNSADVLAVLDIDELTEFNADATQAAWQQLMGELYNQTRLPEYAGHLDSPPMNELKEAMFRAVQEDDGDKICFLADIEPSLINAEREKTRETPLEVVAKEPNSMLLAATKALCSRGASIEAVTGENDRNPLHHAALARNNEVLEILVQHCGYAALCRRDKRAATPLDIAMETGDHVAQKILTCTHHHHVGESAA
jgi:ankyrin repeat protein